MHFRNCPHCSNQREVDIVTTKAESMVGLVYLRMKCLDCDSTIEAAGRGEKDALDDLDGRIRRRAGTPASRWKIRPHVRRRR